MEIKGKAGVKERREEEREGDRQRERHMSMPNFTMSGDDNFTDNKNNNDNDDHILIHRIINMII